MTIGWTFEGKRRSKVKFDSPGHTHHAQPCLDLGTQRYFILNAHRLAIV